MPEYDYDEGGLMALYFLLTFLIVILVPLTASLVPAWKTPKVSRCECTECLAKEKRTAHSRAKALLNPTPKGVLATVLWSIFFAVAYKLATTAVDSKIYDPFTILGLAPTDDEKAIKRHYKRLSVKFHPDKVKLAVNQTIEEVSAHFVDLTKAYKALTDEAIRENLRLYGNPDGKQDFKIGIALPPWIIESSNNVWVLGFYALLFGGALPYLVGKWWFNSRQYTKDGVKGSTAEVYFKNIKEEDTMEDIINTLAKGWQFEADVTSPPKEEAVKLESSLRDALGAEKWDAQVSSANEATKRALILLYAYLLRLPIQDSSLLREQNSLLLHTPQFLTSILSIALSHNWLIPSLHVMHLHAYLAQALRPGSSEILQFPAVKEDDVVISGNPRDLGRLVRTLSAKGDRRVGNIQKAAANWAHLHIIDVGFKVIGERIITPGAIVQLIFKLSLTSPLEQPSPSSDPASLNETDVDAAKRVAKSNDEREAAFLNSKKEAEDLDPSDPGSSLAHAPHWPDDRRPQWWVFIGDQKQNRIIVPPIRISDVPYSSSSSRTTSRPGDRIYKLQFQAPPQVGTYSFQVHFVSDTFVGESARRTVSLKVEDLSALTADEQGAEDEISDPDEDTLAGQMAALRGGSVKKSALYESDDDESTTDGEQSSGSDSDSDSD